GEPGARGIPGGAVAAGELVVGLPRALELLGGEGHARRRPLAAEGLKQLLEQDVLGLPDALAGVERGEEMDAALAGPEQLLGRRVPAGAVAHELDRIGGPVELPRR